MVCGGCADAFQHQVLSIDAQIQTCRIAGRLQVHQPRSQSCTSNRLVALFSGPD